MFSEEAFETCSAVFYQQFGMPFGNKFGSARKDPDEKVNSEFVSERFLTTVLNFFGCKKNETLQKLILKC